MVDFSRAKLIFQGGNVKRYHTFPTLKEQTNAAHSWGVAVLVALLFESHCTAELLKAALWHDVAEIRTGDIPRPVKNASPEVARVVKKLEYKTLEQFNLVVDLSPDEERILQVCDKIESLIFLVHEWNLGNRYAKDRAEDVLKDIIRLAEKKGRLVGQFIAAVDFAEQIFEPLIERKKASHAYLD